MLDTLTVRTFKSLEDVAVDLGLVNVFIGSNGSGKSNLLEALGVLSAAADGKVDDMATPRQKEKHPDGNHITRGEGSP